MIAYALRAEFEGTVTQRIDGKDVDTPKFLGGIIRAGEEDLNIAELLAEGNGTIVVDDHDPRVALALDEYPALRRVAVPDGAEPEAGTYAAKSAADLKAIARRDKIAGGSSATKPDLVIALEERDRRVDVGPEALAELGEPLTVGALVDAAAKFAAGDTGENPDQGAGDGPDA